MTNTSESTDVRPPVDYPYPDWAPEEDKTFFVREELRADYATWEVDPRLEAAYWRDGANYLTGYSFEAAIARADAAGRAPEKFSRLEDFLRVEPTDFVQQRGRGDDTWYIVESTTRLDARAGFHEWLHLSRLEFAAHRQRQRDLVATMRGARSA